MSSPKQPDTSPCWDLFVWGHVDPNNPEPECPWAPYPVYGTRVYHPIGGGPCYAYAYYDSATREPLNVPVHFGQISKVTIKIHAGEVHAGDTYASSFACNVEALSTFDGTYPPDPISKLAYFAIVNAQTGQPGDQIPVARLMPPDKVDFQAIFCSKLETFITTGKDDIKLGKITIFVEYGEKGIIIPCDPEYDHDNN